MITKINISLYDIDDKEILRKENITLSAVPNIGDSFDFISIDQGYNEQIHNEQKDKGSIRVVDVTHVYFEIDKSHTINITLAFSNDKRFYKKSRYQ